MKTIAIALITLFSLNAFSQTLEVRYSEKTAVSSQIKNLDIPDVEGINSMMIKQLIQQQVDKPRIFSLTSSEQRSVYEAISSEEKSTGNISMMVDHQNEKIFRDFTNKNLIHQKQFLSRQFIIDEESKNSEWKILNETKTILGYKCKKAVSKTDDSVVAWYTSDISSSVGPREYYGLPGLILEVKDDSLTITAIDVKLADINTKLEAPTKGKKVSREEYDEIVNKKMNINGQGQDGVKVKVITM